MSSFDIRENSESNIKFHTYWLNMMYPRLKLAKDLLSDDEMIFMSSDDNEVEHLRKYVMRYLFYKGISEIFEKIKKLIEENVRYREFDIKVEHYIVSTGITQVIKGSLVNEFADDLGM